MPLRGDFSFVCLVSLVRLVLNLFLLLLSFVSASGEEGLLQVGDSGDAAGKGSRDVTRATSRCGPGTNGRRRTGGPRGRPARLVHRLYRKPWAQKDRQSWSRRAMAPRTQSLTARMIRPDEPPTASAKNSWPRGMRQAIVMVTMIQRAS